MSSQQSAEPRKVLQECRNRECYCHNRLADRTEEVDRAQQNLDLALYRQGVARRDWEQARQELQQIETYVATLEDGHVLPECSPTAAEPADHSPRLLTCSPD